MCIYTNVPVDIKDSFQKAELYLNVYDVEYPENPNDTIMQHEVVGKYVVEFQ